MKPFYFVILPHVHKNTTLQCHNTSYKKAGSSDSTTEPKFCTPTSTDKYTLYKFIVNFLFQLSPKCFLCKALAYCLPTTAF